MDFNLITGFPDWYILFCIFSGILASVLLYFRDRNNEFRAWIRILLGISRFFAVALIAFLLLSPLVKITSRNIEKPIVVVAQDNSTSIVSGEDSMYFRNSYREEMNAMLEQLKEEYDLRLFTFGEQVVPGTGNSFDSLGFDGRYTDIASLYDMMGIRFINRNVGALLIASDGIYNQGLNPRYHSGSAEYPVYTLTLGDTSTRRDAFFKRVRYNKIAFQGNEFPVEVILNATRMNGATLSMSLIKGGEVVEKRLIAVEGDNFSRSLRLRVTAGEAGMHHYVLRLTSNREEVSRENNRYDLFVDVLSTRQKVLILYKAPHPDIAALKDAISSNINYEVTDAPASGYLDPLNEYSLIILHQFPSSPAQNPALFDRVKRSGIPLLFIIGTQSKLSAFSGPDFGLQIVPYQAGGLNEAVPEMNEAFSFFIPGPAIKALLPAFPPLSMPFARYRGVSPADVFLYQKIGNIRSNDPLWMVSSLPERRTGLVMGTGIWKWRVRTWLETGRHDAFNELINKTVQYLSLREDKRRFRVFAEENVLENAELEFSAELYNESYEAFNEPDVSLQITDEEGDTYNYLFNKAGDAYSLMPGNFPVGTYTYTADVRVNGELFTDAGGFTVTPVFAEQASLRADHALLRALAVESGGLSFTTETIRQFPEMLSQRDDIKARIHAERRYIEFIDIMWIMAVIVLLLAVEWFLRKWSGNY